MLVKDPNSSNALELLGRIAIQEGRGEEASYLETALVLNPLDRLGLQLLNACYHRVGLKERPWRPVFG
jgi:hypothetical protein